MSDKFENLLKQLKKAFVKFKEIMQEKKNEIVRDSAIQRFEFTFELAWKAMKAYLEEKRGAKELYFPKDVIKNAFQAGILEDDPNWSKMAETRNLTSHLYKESMAESAYSTFSSYLPLIDKLIKELEK